MQHYLTKRLLETKFAPLWVSVGKVIIGVIVMSLVVGFGWWGIRTNLAMGSRADMLALGGLIPLGVAVYGLTLWRLNIDGREDIIEVWRLLCAPKS